MKMQILSWLSHVERMADDNAKKNQEMKTHVKKTNWKA